MTNQVVSITLDPITKGKIDKFAEQHLIARSVAIRLILNDFFLKQDDSKIQKLQ